jgi:hypothetical protein
MSLPQFNLITEDNGSPPLLGRLFDGVAQSSSCVKEGSSILTTCFPLQLVLTNLVAVRLCFYCPIAAPFSLEAEAFARRVIKHNSWCTLHLAFHKCLPDTALKTVLLFF